jgi:iron complex transport system substrate-binding protein
VKEAEAAARRVEARLTDIRRRVEGRPRPRTLLIHGREPGSLQRINASGGYGFLHDLLQLAGGNDVLSDFKRQSVEMSTEMVLARAPEVIIELQYGDSPRRNQIDAETRVWDALPSVPAVRRKQVHVLVGDEFVVPGPRIAQAAERFARTLHPDGFR